jgi:DNA-binding CsgD family transcriptional regulator
VTPPDLLGREPELEQLHRPLDQLSDGGTAILLSGEPGIGKTALLTEVAARARERGVRVLTATGVESEAQIPFAGLHQLLHPLLSRPDELPPTQRDLIWSALGLNDLPPPPPFRTALAVLELLVEAAAERPLLIAVEDVHCLDQPTWDVLSFLGRRLEADPIMLVASCRNGPAEQELLSTTTGFTQILLEGLSEEAAGALLDTHCPGLAPAIRAQVLQEALGNPLALVELPTHADRVDKDGALPAWLPLTTRLEQAFAVRMAGLPAATRSLLLVAALDDGDTIDEILAAGSRMVGSPLGLENLVPAVEARLITADGSTIRFRHPLVRSAVGQGASLTQRHAAHAALAAELRAETYRQVWHRAAANTGPDEKLAADLEAAADRATRRGAVASAQAALEAAARLSEDPQARGARLLQAAESAFQLGRRDALVRLLHEAESIDLDESQQTRLAWFRETLLATTWSGDHQIAGFVRIANLMRQHGDTDRALDALRTVSMRCWWSSTESKTRAKLRSAAELIDVPPDDPRMLEVLSLAAPDELGAVLLDRLDKVAAEVGDPEQLHMLGVAANSLGAFDRAAPLLGSAAIGLRAQGRLGILARTLLSDACASLNLGRPDIGRSAAEEAERLAVDTGQPLWRVAAQAVGAALAARRGELVLAETQAAAAETALLRVGAHPLLALVQLARGIASLGAGRYGEAFDHLSRIYDPGDVAHHTNLGSWAVADLAEAAVHGGRQPEVRPLMDELEPLLAMTRSPVLRINHLYADVLLTDDDDAEAAFDAALAVDHTAWPFQRARLQLAYGVWLRRKRRAAESRGPLRTAVGTFQAIGATPWLERARQELRASGETLRRHDERLVDQLTPQELQIAQLAAEGLTNREIGDQLYLSHRTVGTHLYRLYPKLQVTSRVQLRKVLAELSP